MKPVIVNTKESQCNVNTHYCCHFLQKLVLRFFFPMKQKASKQQQNYNTVKNINIDFSKLIT